MKEENITIHFQRKKNGGGEVEKVTLLTGGQAMVVFEDPTGSSNLFMFLK